MSGRPIKRTLRGRDGQHAGHCSPTALNQRTNAGLRPVGREQAAAIRLDQRT